MVVRSDRRRSLMVKRQPAVSVTADSLKESADCVLGEADSRIELADERLLVLCRKTLCRYFRLDDPKEAMAMMV